MKYSISNIGWEESKDQEILEFLKENGVLGLEIAPTRIFPDSPYSKLEEAKIWSKSLLEQYEMTVSSMQSIWFGRSENIFSSEEERKTLLEYTKAAIDFAEAVGAGNLVFGCPKNRNLEDGQSSDPAKAFFRELGDYAYAHNTILAMEANPAIYNTNYVNTTKEAIELVKEVDSKGFLLNLDIGTMVENQEDVEILTGNIHLINHVHLSEPFLKPIEQRELHGKIAEKLRTFGYKNFVSIEMGKQEEIKKIFDTVKYLQEVFYGTN